LLCRRLPVASVLPVAVLLVLAAICFARLFADPTALMVDGQRPSIDYANTGEPRPVGNDATFVFLPHHLSISRLIGRFGHVPLWDARGFGGRPMVGNPQGGMFYPPVWLVWWSGAPAALGWLTVGHLIWGGLGVYALCRSLRLGRWAATVAAGTFQASPLLLAHTFEGHYPHVWAVCWYPWAFWAYREVRVGRWAGFASLPIILALMFLTGHPQEWLLFVVAWSGWVAFDVMRGTHARGEVTRSWSGGEAAARPLSSPADGRSSTPAPPSPPSTRLRWRRAEGRARGVSATIMLSWLAAMTVSLGMTAVELAPQWAVRPWLRRNHEPALKAELPKRHHLSGLNFFQLLSPQALGGPADYFGDDNYWETVVSIGIVPLLLIVAALARHPKRRLVLGWSVLFALALWFAGGRNVGFFRLVYAAVPGMSLFRVPARSLFLANLAAAVLTGLGLEALAHADRATWRRLATWFATAAIVVVGFLGVARNLGITAKTPSPALRASMVARPGEMPEPMPAKPPAHGRVAMAADRILQDPAFWVALAATAAITIVASLCSSRGARERTVRLLGLLALCELGWSGYALVKTAPARQFVGPSPVARLSTTALPAPRVKARDRVYGDLAAVIDGIEKTNVNDAYQLEHSSVLYETLYPIASHRRPMAERMMSPSTHGAWRLIRQAVLDRMGVAYLVSDRIEPDPGWPLDCDATDAGSALTVQTNPSVLPRAYVVSRATVPDHPGVMLTSFVDIDPRRSVLMSFDPLHSLLPGVRQPFTVARWESADHDRPVLTVTTVAPGLLVVADTWMPGWTARVDGEPAPVLRGNHAQRVIALLQPGRHRIEMCYRPPGLAAGCAISLASLLAWGALCCIRPRPTSNSSGLRSRQRARARSAIVRSSDPLS
jgi:hypothetical protein